MVTTEDTHVAKYCECGCGLPTPMAKITRKHKGQIAGSQLRFVGGHETAGRTSPNQSTVNAGQPAK